MRLFIGVELDEAVTAAASRAARDLQGRLETLSAGPQARWISRANLHITLWFLGDVDESRAQALIERLSAPWDLPAFDLCLQGCGVFPPSGAPRVLWIGVADGLTEMRALYRQLQARLEPLGFEAEKRPYTPHLTIARVKEPGRRPFRAVRQAIERARCECGVSRVQAVTLFRSRLSPHGAAYEALLRVPLA